MKKEYFINIENPCKKIEWAKMSNTEGGKFCCLCSKNVVDFSVLSDSEIIKIIENPTREICAKLSPLQSNRLLAVPSERNNFQLSKMMTTLLILGSSKNAIASELIVRKPEFSIVAFNENLENNSLLERNIVATDTLKNSISGTVIEEYNEEIMDHTSVFVENTNISTVTDKLGNFTLYIPDDYTANSIILVVKATGWEKDTRTTVYYKDLPIKNLIIKKESPMVGEYTIKRKRKWWQFWKKKYY